MHIIRPDYWQRQHLAHSGDWLHTLPISACGLHLEDNAIRVAVGLRLGMVHGLGYVMCVRLINACVVPKCTDCT